MNRFGEQSRTLDDIRRKLARYGKCAMVRPTGFGKTCILTDLIKEYVAARRTVLYVYPSAVVRDTVLARYHGDRDYEDEDRVIDPETETTAAAVREIPGCDLMTYAKLARMTPDEIADMRYGMIVFDEMHRMCGRRTRTSVERLFAGNPGAAFAGATATPNRMDGLDAISLFFTGIMTYSYTLLDAVRDGILQRPHYCYCTYDVDADLRDECLTAGEDPDDPVVTACLAVKRVELADLFGMPSVIRTTCERYAARTDYMKFIVFFSTTAHMHDALPRVTQWFRDAYPAHDVRGLCISSRSRAEANNVSQLSALSARIHGIDLIGCVDMLNLGYHVKDLTGIMMYRGTRSNTIFIQQLGRAMSAGSSQPGIVFDVVDNLHRKAVYDLDPGRPTGSRTVYRLSRTNPARVVHKDGGETEVPTQYRIRHDPSGEPFAVDARGNRAGFTVDETLGTVTAAVPAYDTANLRECIRVTGHIATYKELLAKAVAEPLSQRCRSALELHFRTWCQRHGVPYPISDAEMAAMYGLSREMFLQSFVSAVGRSGTDYPLSDVQKLLSMGTGDNNVPLEICARAKNVSVAQILSMLTGTAGVRTDG